MNHALGHCIHYDPDSRFGLRASCEGVCRAGVAYRDVRLRATVYRQGSLPVVLPCTSDARDVPEANTCPSRVWPTPEQVKEGKAEIEAAVQAIEQGKCPQCGAPLKKRTVRRGGGYTAFCPNCPDVGIRACGRGR